MKRYVIGIDVGGTNIKFGLIDPQGVIRARLFLPTRDFIRTRQHLIAGLIAGCRDIIQKSKVSASSVLGVGIGLPGLINAHKGLVYSLTNISGWSNVPLTRIIKDKIGIPVFIDNDVNVITLAEWKCGAGRKMKNMVCITIGTGLGGGLIINDALYRGEGFAAGEIGHVPVNEQGQKCQCGGWGCLETYTGNRYLNIDAAKKFGPQATLETISEKAKQGNKKAIRFWAEVGEHLGNGLTGIVNVLNPRCIVIGGGIANAPECMFKTVRKTIRIRAMHVQGKMVKVVRSTLKNDAGIIGAYVLVQEMLKENA